MRWRRAATVAASTATSANDTAAVVEGIILDGLREGDRHTIARTGRLGAGIGSARDWIGNTGGSTGNTEGSGWRGLGGDQAVGGVGLASREGVPCNMRAVEVPGRLVPCAWDPSDLSYCVVPDRKLNTSDHCIRR